MAKVVIFGTQDFAQLAHFYLTREGRHEVAAFTVHQRYIENDSFLNLPVVPFDTLESSYPPEDYLVFAPMSSAKMNSIRQGIYEQIKSKGYRCISYISPSAIYYGTPIGENCFIFENNVIQPLTTIGDNVIMWSGNHFGHHSSISDHCFIASHVVISGHVTIERNCFIGVNATLNNGITVAKNTFIGSGALVTASTQEFGVYPGTAAELSRVPSNKLRGV
jgi:sugar O-acyltransferase (sialic acid O-acetyltransferase NeuD family)